MGILILALYVLVLAVFVGLELVNKVPPTLHTPLISGVNAVSGIILIGALYTAKLGSTGVAAALGMIAVALAVANAVGGFLMTDRLLAGRKGARR